MHTPMHDLPTLLDISGRIRSPRTHMCAGPAIQESHGAPGSIRRLAKVRLPYQPGLLHCADAAAGSLQRPTASAAMRGRMAGLSLFRRLPRTSRDRGRPPLPGRAAHRPARDSDGDHASDGEGVEESLGDAFLFGEHGLLCGLADQLGQGP